MPQPAFAIPVITRSEPGGTEFKESIQSLRPFLRKPRTYDEKPLPLWPNDHSPKKAQIVSRNLDSNGVRYWLKIGEVDVHDVGVEEILEYVSALDLEAYENRQFKEEIEVLNALEAERQNVKRRQLERQKERSKRKGGVIFEETDSEEGATKGSELELGRHDRARPTYTHLFKVPVERKRQPGDLHGDAADSRSDNEENLFTENELRPQGIAARSSAPSTEPPKRRRRKRDKVTGELLALSPTATRENIPDLRPGKKRNRRRRHPLTGHLMPVGWRYDPENPEDTYEWRRQGLGSNSLKKLSISEEPQAKRQRVETDTSVSRSSSPFPTKAQLAAQHSPIKPDISRSPQAWLEDQTAAQTFSTDEESKYNERSEMAAKRPSPRQVSGTPKLRTFPALESKIVSSTPESSPQPLERTSILQPSASKIRSQSQAQGTRTSILNPSYKQHSSTDPAIYSSTGSGDDEEDMDDDEWVVEAIVGHRLSDPSSHPASFGKEPVMLYRVKWEDYDELTWEPVESFGERSLVTDYRRHAGLDPEDDSMIAGVPSNKSDALLIKTELEISDDDSQEGEFEIESILGHELSDPRTHPAELGGTAVVLYKVKWVGWDEPTWEPAASFEDKTILQQYHNRTSR